MSNIINKTIQHLNSALETLQFDTDKDSIQKVLNQLDEAKKLLSTEEEIFIQWNYEDILCAADNIDISITKEQAIEILQNLKREHDASMGITWDVIGVYIEQYIE